MIHAFLLFNCQERRKEGAPPCMKVQRDPAKALCWGKQHLPALRPVPMSQPWQETWGQAATRIWLSTSQPAAGLGQPSSAASVLTTDCSQKETTANAFQHKQFLQALLEVSDQCQHAASPWPSGGVRAQAPLMPCWRPGSPWASAGRA